MCELSLFKEKENFIHLLDQQEVTAWSQAPQLNTHRHRETEHQPSWCSHFERAEPEAPLKNLPRMQTWQETH